MLKRTMPIKNERSPDAIDDGDQASSCLYILTIIKSLSFVDGSVPCSGILPCCVVRHCSIFILPPRTIWFDWHKAWDSMFSNTPIMHAEPTAYNTFCVTSSTGLNCFAAVYLKPVSAVLGCRSLCRQVPQQHHTPSRLLNKPPIAQRNRESCAC